MTSKKKYMISINQNKITLPPDLIPEDVTQLLIESLEDGRLILSPMSPAAQVSPASQASAQKSEKIKGLADVVDIRLGRKKAKKTKEKKQQRADEGRLEEDSPAEDGFVGLHHFPSRMEAEMIGEILKQAGLPYLIQSEDIGIFGPGAAPAPGGAGLVVRGTDLEYARTLLAGLI